MFHRERPELGGDGGLAMSIAERLGVPAALVPVRSLGTVDANAAIIRDHLRAEPEPVIWLTHSKATPDTVAALVAEPALAQRIALWISVGGSPGGSLWMEPGIGSPLAHLVRRIWLRVRGGVIAATRTLKKSFPQEARVVMRAATREEIAEYVALGESLDKAGGYAIQEQGDLIVAGFTGSLTNIIGLPLEETKQLLTRAGLTG